MNATVTEPATAKGLGRKSAINRRMAEVRALPDDLLGGTPQMRLAGTKWIPREDGESLKTYRARLNRSFLRPLYEDTLDKLSARPFARRNVKLEMKQGATLDPRLEVIERDADNEGTDLTQFAQQLLRWGIHEGAIGLLVDFPAVAPGFTHDRELSGELHPYFAPICMWAILGFTHRKGEDGRKVLTSLRVVERNTADEGDSDRAAPSAVRMHFEGKLDGAGVRGKAYWQVWTEMNRDVWSLTSSGTYSVSKIPFVIAYLNKVGFMESKPCMLGLAWLNGEHWQRGSSHANGEHFSSIPLFYESGADQNTIDEPFVIASNRAIKNTRADGKLSVVETIGTALGMLRKTLEGLEAAAEAMGMQPLIEGSANVTATGHVLNETRSSSALQAWIHSVEKLLVEAYRLAAEILGNGSKSVQLPTDFNVDIFSDFALPARAGAEVDQLLKLYQAGALSLKTLLKEIKRRSMLPEELDVDAEVESIHEEGPRLGMLGLGFGGDPAGGGGAPGSAAA